VTSWHTRHPDKAITDPAEIAHIVAGQKFLTLALCAENQPYLVTLSHAFDAEHNCFYFHCAPVGRKLDLIRANPQVYGQVLEDCGYVAGDWIATLDAVRAARAANRCALPASTEVPSWTRLAGGGCDSEEQAKCAGQASFRREMRLRPHGRQTRA
jgi:hypothetical protein